MPGSGFALISPKFGRCAVCQQRSHSRCVGCFILRVAAVAIAMAPGRATSPLPKTGAKMAKKKKVIRREWTKDDVRQMKTMAKAKAGTTRIAKSLKRTTGATAVMAAKLGVSLSMRA